MHNWSCIKHHWTTSFRSWSSYDFGASHHQVTGSSDESFFPFCNTEFHVPLVHTDLYLTASYFIQLHFYPSLFEPHVRCPLSSSLFSACCSAWALLPVAQLPIDLRPQMRVLRSSCNHVVLRNNHAI